MKYRIAVPKSVQRQLDSLPSPIYDRVYAKLMTLSDNPYPKDSIKLRGYNSQYRVRVGAFRIRYQVQKAESTIVLINCKPRKIVYRK